MNASARKTILVVDDSPITNLQLLILTMKRESLNRLDGRTGFRRIV